MNKQLITIFSIFSITCLGMVSAQESKSFLPEVKKESLTFSSEDNKFKLTFNGRIQADGAMFFGEDYQLIDNGVVFSKEHSSVCLDPPIESQFKLIVLRTAG